MFIPATLIPTKAYAAYSFIPASEGVPATLLDISGHTSRRAAEAGRKRQHAEVANLSVVVTGWFLFEPDMREHGYVL